LSRRTTSVSSPFLTECYPAWREARANLTSYRWWLSSVESRAMLHESTKLLTDIAESISLVRVFLEDRYASLDNVIHKTGSERNAVSMACKEAANEKDESRKRFEMMCRELFKKIQGLYQCMLLQNPPLTDFQQYNTRNKSLPSTTVKKTGWRLNRPLRFCSRLC
jgi:hypothetical protein